MKWKVLISAPYLQDIIERFRPTFEENGIEILVPPVSERLEEEELLRYVEGIHGVICGDDRFTSRVLEAATDLKVISKWGTGIDSIDKDACKRLGIALYNTPNAFSEPVADTVFGYILCFARNIPWMDRKIKQGIWKKLPGLSLRESTLGIIGVGNVGKAVVRRAQCFGMRIMGNDLVKMPSDFISQTGIRMVEKEVLLKDSDFVSVNCDLNPTSYHLLGDREFALMKGSACVINTARGPIIEEKALVKALEERKIAGAALDVFENEPIPADSPLLSMDNVLLAPHNANSSPEAWEKVHHNTIANLLNGLRSGRR